MTTWTESDNVADIAFIQQGMLAPSNRCLSERGWFNCIGCANNVEEV